MLDLIIKNGKIVDGTGNPWFYGDVGIQAGKIVRVGKVDQESREVINAKRQVISPGFIDGHCHSDLMILDYPESEIKLQQGVTTEVTGNCGLGPFPSSPLFSEMLKSYVTPILGESHHPWPWTSLEEYRQQLIHASPSCHTATYVAHGSLRIAVMGFANRPASAEELAQMQTLLEEGLQAGAIGLSIGLLYAPGSYTKKEELAQLCRVLPKYHGLLSTHIRGEGQQLLSSIREVIWIAEQSGVPLHISHLKAAGRSNWGKIEQAMDLIEEARTRGLDVTCDVYPYSAGSTTLTTILPPWVLEGGIHTTLARLADASLRQQIKQELQEEQDSWDNLIASTGWDHLYLSAVASEQNRIYEGKHIEEISQSRGVEPADCVFDLLLEEQGNISIVFFHMDENDIREVIRWDRSLVASDSLTCLTGKPHPRLYGTFPRLLAKYVRQEKLLSLEQAVRKITSFPVQRFKLGKRGIIAPGYEADLVLFDPGKISDQATYDQPRQYPEGISYVWVSGQKSIVHGQHTQAKAGTFIPADACLC